MKFFLVVTVFVLSLLAIANAAPLPDPNRIQIGRDCKYCNFFNSGGPGEELYYDDE
ncbi:bomanin Short 2-like isoform X1 [Drosophila ficusphila]|uniref:bomanin Short 2-like isoform X1 n=1 Tax=Drosophila ficusphila TaxID=30025 RepID=UPI0007E7C9BE|nr:bomanin Short 2-like isoform X1 [Drosophila ficusphila]